MNVISGQDRQKRFLLINPPHPRRVVRDCYCSDIVKASYYWHPMDLVVQAALLAPLGEVRLIDAIAERTGLEKTLQTAVAFDPDMVLCLVGAVCSERDLAFCRALKETLPRAMIVGTGDMLLRDVHELAGDDFPFDAILQDFTSPQLAQLQKGNDPQSDMAIRHGDQWVQLPRSNEQTFSYPSPPKVFNDEPYRLPFYGDEPFHSVLASFGCPYQCRFCHVPSLGYKFREPSEVFEEIRQAATRGIRCFYLRDATFAVDREKALLLVDSLSSIQPPVRWNCFSRADLLDDELLQKMAASGCAAIQMGVETIDRDACNKAGKNCDQGQLRQVLQTCRRLGILTSLHFVLGLPGDNWITSRQASKDITGLNPDYVSFNILQPRHGSAMRTEGLSLSDSQVAEYRALAKRLSMRFYLRPGRLVTELARHKNPRDLLRAAGMFLSSLFSRQVGSGAGRWKKR